jgi:predicted enzyme related to lactoylglutathione lyase
MAQPAHRHHALDYVEISVTDVAEARNFYSSAFGWVFNEYGPDYAGIQDPGRPGAAVAAAGGRITNGPYDFPGGRRFHFTDPSGNELGVWAERS